MSENSSRTRMGFSCHNFSVNSSKSAQTILQNSFKNLFWSQKCPKNFSKIYQKFFLIPMRVPKVNIIVASVANCYRYVLLSQSATLLLILDVSNGRFLQTDIQGKDGTGGWNVVQKCCHSTAIFISQKYNNLLKICKCFISNNKKACDSVKRQHKFYSMCGSEIKEFCGQEKGCQLYFIPRTPKSVTEISQL